MRKASERVLFSRLKGVNMCKHEQSMLMGTADGIVCIACGATFANFDEVLKARGEKPEEVKEEPKKKRSKKS